MPLDSVLEGCVHGSSIIMRQTHQIAWTLRLLEGLDLCVLTGVRRMARNVAAKAMRTSSRREIRTPLGRYDASE